MRKAFGLIIFTLIFLPQFFGCARTLDSSTELADWTRVKKVDGCLSYASIRGQPRDINIELKPNMEKLLLSYIQDKKIESPSCWYEQPDGGVILRAGQYCGFPKEAHFRKVESGWSLIEFKELYVQCEQRER